MEILTKRNADALTFSSNTSSISAEILSKKRRRITNILINTNAQIEPSEAATKVLAMPIAVSPRCMGGATPVVDDAVTSHDLSKDLDKHRNAVSKSKEGEEDSMSKSLMGLSLQLKLKMVLVEAWASDMNCIVMERNLFSIAKELAILKEMGVYVEHTCLRFLELARTRMMDLLVKSKRTETLQMEAIQMWTMAKLQSQHDSTQTTSNHPVVEQEEQEQQSKEFPLLSAYDTSSRDISVLWKAMCIAKDRGAQLWHENKHEQALSFLLAADSYMKRFTLKYQRLKIDHAMVDALGSTSSSSSGEKSIKRKRVSFDETPVVMGIADPNVDRSPICASKPSKLEALLLRTSREFPTPGF